MRTESTEYSEYLNNKYLPGRPLFLKYIYYPRILNEFKTEETIWDLGCGTGEFLSFCKKKHRIARGIDSNLNFITLCENKGLSAVFDDLCQLKSISDNSIENALTDNVLEHLTITEIKIFFETFERKATDNSTLICVVPGPKGFKKDPTHKTYIDKSLLLKILGDKKFKINKQFNHPFPTDIVSRFLYLNMQVFIIKKTTDYTLPGNGINLKSKSDTY